MLITYNYEGFWADVAKKINQQDVSEFVIAVAPSGGLTTQVMFRVDDYLSYEYLCSKIGRKPKPASEFMKGNV